MTPREEDEASRTVAGPMSELSGAETRMRREELANAVGRKRMEEQTMTKDELEHAVIRDSGFRLQWADADLEHAELIDALEHALHHLDASDCTDGKRVYEDTMRLRAFVEYLESREEQ
jgi:hypothetical protein